MIEMEEDKGAWSVVFTMFLFCGTVHGRWCFAAIVAWRSCVVLCGVFEGPGLCFLLLCFSISRCFVLFCGIFAKRP